MIKDSITFIKKLIVTTSGCLILGFGCGMLVVANIGGDPVTVFCTALAKLYPVLTVGNWASVFCVLMIILTLIVNRKFIGITTIVYTLFGQITIDLCTKIVPFQNTLIGGILMLLLASIIISIAVALIAAGDLGYCAYDAIILAVSKKFKTSYKNIRYFFDGFFLVVGYLIGGLVGVGTIICLFLMGYVVDTGMKILTPIFRKLFFKVK